MNAMTTFPKRCRESIRRITNETGIPIETAYAMMLMTATLMDLKPEDEQVVDIILADCGVTIKT